MATQGVSYRSLPHKLIVLMLARFVEPLTTSSIHVGFLTVAVFIPLTLFQSYIFFQLRYFNPSASAATISAQSGLIIGCKTAAHVCTGLLWGRLADHIRIGRKTVLVVGLLASSLATLGYGISGSFKAALIWQMLDGALNATIAMVRCMTAELNPEKRYRVRAFTLLPLAANMGSLLGPLIGGFLVSIKTESPFFKKYPYAAPNICVASVQIIVAVTAFLLLKETLHHDFPCGGRLQEPPSQVQPHYISTAVAAQEIDETSSLLPRTPTPVEIPTSNFKRLPFRKIWTANVIRTMIAQFIISGHLGTFTSLWAIFLSIPTRPLHMQHPPFHFSGGLGLQPYGIGVAMSTFGIAGILLQILMYPMVQERFGTIPVWRGSLCIFPLVYILAPFCALVASLGQRKSAENGFEGMPVLEWALLILILILFAAGRTGLVPATSLLINDCTPHPSVRGTIHTAAVIVSNLSKTVFPPMALSIFGHGLELGVVGLGFWFVAALAVLSFIASIRVREGTNGEDPARGTQG